MDKRSQIIDLALQRFYDLGFQATSIEAALEGSGISKRTVYKYFPTKEDLVEAVLDRYAGLVLAELFDPLEATTTDPVARILGLFDQRRVLCAAHPGRGCLAMKAVQEYVGRHAGILSHGQRAAEGLRRRLADYARQAGFSAPDVLARQLVILFQGAVLLSVAEEGGEVFAPARMAAKTLLDAAPR